MLYGLLKIENYYWIIKFFSLFEYGFLLGRVGEGLWIICFSCLNGVFYWVYGNLLVVSFICKR